MRQIERRRLQQGEGRKGRSVRRRRVVVTLDAYFHPYAVTSPLPNPPPDHQGHPLRPSASLASEQAVGNGRFCISGALPAHIGAPLDTYSSGFNASVVVFYIPDWLSVRVFSLYVTYPSRNLESIASPDSTADLRKGVGHSPSLLQSPSKTAGTAGDNPSMVHSGNGCLTLAIDYSIRQTLYQSPLGSAYPLIIHLQRQDDSSSKRAFITNSEHERELSFPNIMQALRTSQKGNIGNRQSMQNPNIQNRRFMPCPLSHTSLTTKVSARAAVSGTNPWDDNARVTDHDGPRATNFFLLSKAWIPATRFKATPALVQI
ncbi:hypothetical protein CIRG_03241 [Coccidioides immitis RMSCC 2394]|uniref:Uncharacterized protein n=2 Tax=Coccidioides TaxID=5500 RepID=A0A0J6Y9V3_COCIT|nr:hypothetical protein CPAG_03799 [Coccidioides posadasii RMSCC 3488]KMP03548.1 hypothetical protein CIRG_03241 [Coccidioides immitis RMSCC 2394]